MLSRIVWASLVQANGAGCWFQWSMNAAMAPVSSRTDRNEPRRMAWRVMTEKKHQVEPGAAGWGEMQGDPRVPGHPGPDLGVLAGGVVVADHVQAGVRVGGSDLLEELEELLVPVLRIARVGDLPGGDVERGEQRRGAVADVVVGLPLGDAGPHRQDGLAALQRLALGLLIDADDHRRVTRVSSSTHDYPAPAAASRSLPAVTSHAIDFRRT